MEKLLKGRGDPKKGGGGGRGGGGGGWWEEILQERGDAVKQGIFSSWGVANALTFNYILVTVHTSLFPQYSC